MVDYSTMEEEIKNTPEPEILKKGTEVLARIISVRTGVSDKNDATWYQPVFDVPDMPLVKEFNDFMWDLADKDKLDEKQAMNAIRRFREFAKAFRIDYSKPFNWEDDLPGLEGWLEVGVKKSDEYGDSNSVRKYISGPSGNSEENPFTE